MILPINHQARSHLTTYIGWRIRSPLAMCPVIISIGFCELRFVAQTEINVSLIAYLQTAWWKTWNAVRLVSEWSRPDHFLPLLKSTITQALHLITFTYSDRSEYGRIQKMHENSYQTQKYSIFRWSTHTWNCSICAILQLVAAFDRLRDKLGLEAYNDHWKSKPRLSLLVSKALASLFTLRYANVLHNCLMHPCGYTKVVTNVDTRRCSCSWRDNYGDF